MQKKAAGVHGSESGTTEQDDKDLVHLENVLQSVPLKNKGGKDFFSDLT